jgi:hypothetical protein
VQPSSSDCHRPPSSSDSHQPECSYWDSPEARKLFRAKEGETTQQSINEQITILTKANVTDESYITVVDGGVAIDPSTLSNYEKHMIRIKSQLLCLSLHLALEKMNSWTWNQCCSSAIKASKRMGISTVENPKTVEKWY